MSNTALARLNGAELARHRKTLLRNTLLLFGFFSFGGVYLSVVAATNGAKFTGVFTSGRSLLATFATVSIALHIPIWSMHLRTDDLKRHLRAAHLYVFALLGGLMGSISCVIAAIMTVAAFAIDDDKGTAHAVTAVGAWILALTLCTLGASSQAVTSDDVIATMAEHDRKQKYHSLGRRANRLAPIRTCWHGLHPGRSRIIGFMAAYSLIPASITFVLTLVIILCVEGTSWWLLVVAVVAALISTALVYGVLYSWAVRWGPEFFMSVSAGLGWIALAGLSAFYSTEDWGSIVTDWCVLFTPLVIVVLHTVAGSPKFWDEKSGSVWGGIVGWSLRPLVRVSVEREQVRYAPPRPRIRLC